MEILYFTKNTIFYLGIFQVLRRQKSILYLCQKIPLCIKKHHFVLELNTALQKIQYEGARLLCLLANAMFLQYKVLYGRYVG